ncbi:MAG: hypothetical protein IJA08_07655 [Clostridia bacterium]|nr:hypothetical protein [Clostridia bacterium]
MKRFVTVLLFFVLCLTLSGCESGSNDKHISNNTYDEKILHIYDEVEGYYYLFFKNNTVAGMDILKYFEDLRNVESIVDKAWQNGNGPYASTPKDPFRKRIRFCRSYQPGDNSDYEDKNKKIRCRFYETLIGRALPFCVYSVDDTANEYYGKDYSEVLYSLENSNSVVSVEVITHIWE